MTESRIGSVHIASLWLHYCFASRCQGHVTVHVVWSCCQHVLTVLVQAKAYVLTHSGHATSVLLLRHQGLQATLVGCDGNSAYVQCAGDACVACLVVFPVLQPFTWLKCPGPRQHKLLPTVESTLLSSCVWCGLGPALALFGSVVLVVVGCCPVCLTHCCG